MNNYQSTFLFVNMLRQFLQTTAAEKIDGTGTCAFLRVLRGPALRPQRKARGKGSYLKQFALVDVDALGLSFGMVNPNND